MSTESYSVELQCDYSGIEFAILSAMKHMRLSYEYPISKRTNPYLIYDNEETAYSYLINDDTGFRAEIHVNTINFVFYRVNVYPLTPDPNNIGKRLIYYIVRAFSVYDMRTSPKNEYMKEIHDEYVEYIQSILEKYGHYVTDSVEFWQSLGYERINTV
jgi:hypothetical protein